jgi:hypothetical protein
LADGERPLLASALEADWLTGGLEEKVRDFAVRELVPRHLGEVSRRKEALLAKTVAAVKDRLTKEITYWDHRSIELRAQEQAGQTPRLNSARAQARADELQARLQRRLEELEQERHLAPLAPVVTGGAIIVPQGLLRRLRGELAPPEADGATTFARDTARVERLAMDAVMAAEHALGYRPSDVSAHRCGYDIESVDEVTGTLRFIEVKGRVDDATTVTVTKNEILTALNKPDEFVLAIVKVGEDGATTPPAYIRSPFQREPDFGVTSVTYRLADLLARAEPVQ